MVRVRLAACVAVVALLLTSCGQLVVTETAPQAPPYDGPLFVEITAAPTVDHHTGWYAESWARCDWAELPPSAAEAVGVQLWTGVDVWPAEVQPLGCA